MTRSEFVRAYAARSGLSDKWAGLGFIETNGHYQIAMPCACSDDCCEGWGMVGPDSVSSHLELYAPPALRDAYKKAAGLT